MSEQSLLRVLVVGAGSGIGRAVAARYGRDGAQVALVGRSADGLDRTASLIADTPGVARALVADVTDHDQLRRQIAAAVDWLGGLDVAINTAGVIGPKLPTAEIPHSAWETTLSTNLTGVFVAMQAEIAAMRSGGAIVNVASNLGAHGRVPGLAAYVTSKAAVSALTRVAALDHIADGIRINAVSPGPIDTAMSIRPGESRDERDARIATTNPSGRVGSLDEVVDAIRYLASPAAGYHVGTDLVLDGGATA